MNQPASTNDSQAKQRRSQRLLLQMPVLVQGVTQGARSFLEETKTLVVNAHGALIVLSRTVACGEELVLKNQKSQEERPCKVVFLGPADSGKNQVGVEFTQPAPFFWHIDFPPDDWAPPAPEDHAHQPV